MKKRGLSPPKMSPPGSGGYRPNPEWFARLLKQSMEHYEELRDPVAHRKRIAATIDFEIAMRVAELERYGIRNPVTQAKEEAAKRWGHDKVEALNRWLRRNRG
jgi:hypothetical protein